MNICEEGLKWKDSRRVSGSKCAVMVLTRGKNERAAYDLNEW